MKKSTAWLLAGAVLWPTAVYAHERFVKHNLKYPLHAEYFRRTTRDQLHRRFLPIVQRATARVELAQKYDQYADRAATVGLLKKEDADLDEYVTHKALDGLYLMVAEEEKKIRKDPVGTGSAIIKKVFGAIRY